MEHLYAPKRNMMQNNTSMKKTNDCTFCTIAEEAHKHEHLLYRDEICFVVMNLYPYSTGHILIIPHKHIISITELESSEWLHISSIVQKMTKLLNDILKTEHINIGININGFAGASIKDHLHIHILPRYKGDTNFMTALFDTRIYSNDFWEVHKKLKENIGNYLP